MRVIKCAQGSAEWLDIRRGKITASRIADVLSVLKKGGEGADRRNYRIEQIAERLSGRSEDHYVSLEMEWGMEFESVARSAYEIATESIVDTVGFVLHPIFDFAGSSPDGLVNENGILEIKCPKTTTHLKWMLAGGVPEEHQAQCLWNMACCDRKWADFVSYDPRLPEGLKIFIARMERDDERIAVIEADVSKFNDEIEKEMSRLRERIKISAPAPGPVFDGTHPLDMSQEDFDSIFGEIVP